MAHSTRHLKEVALALHYFIGNMLSMRNVFMVRVGNGVPSFPKCDEAEISLIVWWTTKLEDMNSYWQDSAKTVSAREVIGDHFQSVKSM